MVQRQSQVHAASLTQGLSAGHTPQPHQQPPQLHLSVTTSIYKQHCLYLATIAQSPTNFARRSLSSSAELSSRAAPRLTRSYKTRQQHAPKTYRTISNPLTGSGGYTAAQLTSSILPWLAQEKSHAVNLYLHHSAHAVNRFPSRSWDARNSLGALAEADTRIRCPVRIMTTLSSPAWEQAAK